MKMSCVIRRGTGASAGVAGADSSPKGAKAKRFPSMTWNAALITKSGENQ